MSKVLWWLSDVKSKYAIWLTNALNEYIGSLDLYEVL